MAKENHSRVSIIIVNYNSGSLLMNCISSIIKCIHADYSIVVFDNASEDDSIEQVQKGFPGNVRIRIIKSPDNLGFARANNEAAKTTRSDYLHFMNPDILVNPVLTADYKKIVEGPSDTVYVTSLADQDGKPTKNRHVIPTMGNYFNLLFHKEKVIRWNIGASLIMSRDSFNLLGGWPEDYFMYAEDLDLFYRMHKLGLNICYLNTGLVHLGQGTTRNIWDERERAIRVERSFLKFYRKYGLSWQYFLFRPVQLAYILFHEPKLFLLQVNTYLRVIFLRDNESTSSHRH